jgi:hypothetical protein
VLLGLLLLKPLPCTQLVYAARILNFPLTVRQLKGSRFRVSIRVLRHILKFCTSVFIVNSHCTFLFASTTHPLVFSRSKLLLYGSTICLKFLEEVCNSAQRSWRSPSLRPVAHWIRGEIFCLRPGAGYGAHPSILGIPKLNPPNFGDIRQYLI